MLIGWGRKWYFIYLYLFRLPVSLKNVTLFQLSLKNCSKYSFKELSPLTRDG